MAKKQSMPLDEALQVILASDGDNPLRQMLEWMAQQAFEHEMAEHLGYRNGHKPRVFTTAELDEVLTAWRTRRLDGKAYPCFFADATYQKVRDCGRVVSRGMLLVMGINTLGRREILSVGIADTENATTWSDTFRDLKERGLTGVLLVTSDHHEGIKAAASRYFQGATWQRCQFHFTQNALPLCSKRERKALRTALRAAFDAENLDRANMLTNEIIIRFQETKPVLADRIDEGMVDALACFYFPPAHRKKIRTSNMLEWLNGELRRDARVVRIFPNEASALRLITALAMEHSEEWETSPRRYMDIDKLEDWVIENNMRVPWLEGPGVWPFDEPGEPAPDGEPAKA